MIRYIICCGNLNLSKIIGGGGHPAPPHPFILQNCVEKTRKKAGMIFSSDFDRRKTKPLIYIKFWKQACLPCRLFGAELFSLNKSQRQQWFLKNVFYVPKFAPGHLLLKISNLNSIESEIDLKNSCF